MTCNYHQLDLKGVSLGKTRPLNEDDLAEFEKLAKGGAGRDGTGETTGTGGTAHWTVDPEKVDRETYDLSVVNPNIEEPTSRKRSCRLRQNARRIKGT